MASEASDEKQKSTLSFRRARAMFFLYAVFASYIFMIQLCYESAETAWYGKLFLLSLVVFGGGLAWDCLKHIFKLPDESLSIFTHQMSQSTSYLFGYIICFLAAFLSFGPLRGWSIIFIGFYVFFSFYFLVKSILAFNSAVEAVAK